MGTGFVGRAQNVLIEVFNALPTASSNELRAALETKLFNAGHLEALCWHDELTQWRHKLVALYVQRIKDAVLAHPGPLLNCVR